MMEPATEHWWLDFGAADWAEARHAYYGVLVFYDLSAAFVRKFDSPDWTIIAVDPAP